MSNFGLCVLFMVIGVVSLVAACVMKGRQRQSEGWPNVTGKLTRKGQKGLGDEDGPGYSMNIEYVYE